MAHKLVYNIQPASPSMISALDRHCLARVPDGASNIDPGRSHLNQTLAGDPAGLMQSLRNLFASGVKKPAAQSESPYLRIVVSASPGYFRPDDPEATGTWDDARLNAWVEVSMHQLHAEHGADLIFAELHLDEDTPHIHAVIAPTYLKKARMPGRQKRGETMEQFEERKAAARASVGVRTVGRASHPTLSKQDSFLRLRERMAIAVDQLGIEYGEDRAINAPAGQSTREWVIQKAAELRKEEAALKEERQKLARERKAIATDREDQLNEALERQRLIERTGKLAADARDRLTAQSREQEERSKSRVAALEKKAANLQHRTDQLAKALAAAHETEEHINALEIKERRMRQNIDTNSSRLKDMAVEEENLNRKIEGLRRLVESLETDEAKLRNAVQLSEDGTKNFDIAMNEVAEVTSAAAEMTLTDEQFQSAQTRAFKDEEGQTRRFATDDENDSLIVRFIRFGFRKALDLFDRIRALTRLNDEIERARTYPEPLVQVQNILNSTRDAITETLTQLGLAQQRPDVGEVDENGDPPPVLDLVFKRAERKAQKLNKELVNRLDMSGPKM
jgi:DNA repair exonuclease SbcCD ATPase subunit